jgi:hypothetical protein
MKGERTSSSFTIYVVEIKYEDTLRCLDMDKFFTYEYLLVMQIPGSWNQLVKMVQRNFV